MVNIKGFTLIEIMIVIAIVGILASIIVGPMHDKAKQSRGLVPDEETSSNSMLVNGVLHECNEFGDCEPVD